MQGKPKEMSGDIMFFAGLLLVFIGAYTFYPPLGYFATGSVLIIMGVILSRGK